MPLHFYRKNCAGPCARLVPIIRRARSPSSPPPSLLARPHAASHDASLRSEGRAAGPGQPAAGHLSGCAQRGFAFHGGCPAARSRRARSRRAAPRTARRTRASVRRVLPMLHASPLRARGARECAPPLPVVRARANLRARSLAAPARCRCTATRQWCPSPCWRSTVCCRATPSWRRRSTWRCTRHAHARGTLASPRHARGATLRCASCLGADAPRALPAAAGAG